MLENFNSFFGWADSVYCIKIGLKSHCTEILNYLLKENISNCLKLKSSTIRAIPKKLVLGNYYFLR